VLQEATRLAKCRKVFRNWSIEPDAWKGNIELEEEKKEEGGGGEEEEEEEEDEDEDE